MSIVEIKLRISKREVRLSDFSHYLNLGSDNNCYKSNLIINDEYKYNKATGGTFSLRAREASELYPFVLRMILVAKRVVVWIL